MKVGIIGSGTMGLGIAQVASTAGASVMLVDKFPEALQKAELKLEKLMNRLVEKGRVQQEEAVNIRKRISYLRTMSELHDADLIIEAIVENPAVKANVFRELEKIISPACILASNTSSLSVTALAAGCEHPQRFIGIHFFNPAPLMKLVEVIPGLQTDPKILEQTRKLITGWGKLVVTAKDTPGFIVNKVARPFYSEALRIYEEGIADFSTIDWAVKEFGGFRMGPFELMDFIGNDVNYAVTCSVFESFFFDPKYKPALTQKQLNDAGWLGRKNGRGYYLYGDDNTQKPKAVEDKIQGQIIFNRLLIMLINEAADTLYLNIASRNDIDTAMTTGVNYPRGLLAWADEVGIAECVHQMDALYNEYHEDRYRCSPLLRKMGRENTRFYEPQKEEAKS